MTEEESKPGPSQEVVTDISVNTSGLIPAGDYPWGTVFILIALFFIAFCSSSLNGLVVYMTERCYYTEDEALLYFHIYMMCAMFVPLFTGIISDSYTGKYKLMVFGMVLATIGYFSLFVGSIPQAGFSCRLSVTLCFVARTIGMGSVSPNMVPLAVEQFNLPQQNKYATQFFGINIALQNIGLFLSSILYPVLRDEIHCLNYHDCYAVGFGVSTAIYMIILMELLAIRPFLRVGRPVQNTLVLTTCCVCYAISNRHKKKRQEDVQKQHWLDFADDKYDLELINDTKNILNIFIVLCGAPFAFALYYQSKTTWTFQARRMDGWFGFFNIKPEMMLTLHTMMTVLSASIYTAWYVPFMRRMSWGRPLALVMIGYIFMLAGYILSGILQLRIDGDAPILPAPGNAQLRIINTINCTFMLDLPNGGTYELRPLELYVDTNIALSDERAFYNMRLTARETTCLSPFHKILSFHIVQNTAITHVLDNKFWSYEESLQKSKNAYPLVSIIANKALKAKRIRFTLPSGYVGLDVDVFDSKKTLIYPSNKYYVLIDGVIKKADVRLRTGGVYIFVVDETGNLINQVTLVAPNDIHMMWQIPQIFIMLWGALSLDAAMQEFLFSEASNRLKSVSWAYGIILRSLGNLIVSLIKKAEIPSKSDECFIFCGLMAASVIVQLLLFKRYRYIREYH